MSYRGEDLDLRTPQGWSATQQPDYAGAPSGEVFFNGPRGRGPLSMSAPIGPIWVDDTLLACCNHAFDVALAHRSAEVRLEHLVYALTRIETAAEALEARGIRVPVLRRESATVIASEIPVGLPPGKAAPRRSDDLEEVLRLAAGNAYRRNAPASVADVLHVILDGPQELSGLVLLRPALQRLAASVPEQSQPRAPVALRADPGSAAPNGPISARLDALEQMVRALSNDLSIEQKTLTGVLQNLQRDVMAQREDPSRLGGSYPDKVLSERLLHLEQSMLSGRTASGPELNFVTDRLGALERALQTELGHIRLGLEALHSKTEAAVDLSPVARRIDALEGRLEGDRANAKTANAALMGEIGALKSGLASAERLEHVAAAVNTLQADVARLLSGLGERLELPRRRFPGNRGIEGAQASYTQEPRRSARGPRQAQCQSAHARRHDRDQRAGSGPLLCRRRLEVRQRRAGGREAHRDARALLLGDDGQDAPSDGREILSAQSLLVLAVRNRRLAGGELAVAIGPHRRGAEAGPEHAEILKRAAANQNN